MRAYIVFKSLATALAMVLRRERTSYASLEALQGEYIASEHKSIMEQVSHGLDGRLQEADLVLGKSEALRPNKYIHIKTAKVKRLNASGPTLRIVPAILSRVLRRAESQSLIASRHAGK